MISPVPDTVLSPPVERFDALAVLPVRHGFVGRVPNVDVQVDRAMALQRLDEWHVRARDLRGLAGRKFITAEQVHGRRVAAFLLADTVPATAVAGVDALVTNRPDLCLGIYVADCCPVFFVDPVRRVIGLAHAGKKGTAQNIAAATVETMRQRFGSHPEDMVAQLGPCIRPPWYEVDIAAQIVEQCRTLGLGKIEDCGICTAANPNQYYSYRREKGRTGRMLAVLALA